MSVHNKHNGRSKILLRYVSLMLHTWYHHQPTAYYYTPISTLHSLSQTKQTIYCSYDMTLGTVYRYKLSCRQDNSNKPRRSNSNIVVYFSLHMGSGASHNQIKTGRNACFSRTMSFHSCFSMSVEFSRAPNF